MGMAISSSIRQWGEEQSSLLSLQELVSLDYIILSDMKQHMAPGAVADIKTVC